MICVTNVINPPFYSQSNTQNMFMTLIAISLIFKKLGDQMLDFWERIVVPLVSVRGSKLLNSPGSSLLHCNRCIMQLSIV